MKVAICQSCGSIADAQSDVVLNGSNSLFSCPICKGSWQEVSEDSLPVQFEKLGKKCFVELQRKTKEEIQTVKEQKEWTQKDEAEFRRLNAKRMKAYRDKKRTRKYSPRPSRLFVK
jgi:hypothetical protein